MKAPAGLGVGRLAVAVLLLVSLTGCQHSGTDASSSAASVRPTRPQPASSSRPTGLGGAGGEQTGVTPRPTSSASGNAKEVPGTCPYISARDFADREGDRVGRVTLLPTQPVGCRFYFEYDPNTVVGEIGVARLPTATEAYNAMVASAHGHPEVQSDRAIGDGAVAFQTPLQGTRAWQCVFAKGTSVVTVRTRQPYPALNAFLLARAIAPKIK
jgi:hypothetical protein